MALRKQDSEIPITLICDHPLLKQLPLQDFQITPRFLESDEIGNHAFSSRQIKTRLYSYSPYQETLFLDADILPFQPIAGLWDYICESDFAMVLDRLPLVSLCDHIAQEEKAYTLQILEKDAVQFNSGVMLWRNTPAVQQLFQQWYEEWCKFQRHDQLALVRAIHRTAISVTKLPKTYNTSPTDAAPLGLGTMNVHLLHCWGGMVGSGEFRRFAHQFYPHIVETAVELMTSSSGSSLLKS
ncbi:MAG: hypothetical protein H7Y37_17750 [Anaerolineae bacterium]|nr:hypothetical protein [Gloeobacterales cyanobacterium ES-bin-313]